MDASTWAVWLIGIGSLLIVLNSVLGSERPSEGVSFMGPLSRRRDRIRFALVGTGAVLVSAGSVVLAVTEPPTPWLAVVVPAIYLGVHLLAAWKLRQYWHGYRLPTATQATAGDIVPDLLRQQLACAEVCSTWRWCLGHPFNGEYWPKRVLAKVEVGN